MNEEAVPELEIQIGGQFEKNWIWLERKRLAGIFHRLPDEKESTWCWESNFQFVVHFDWMELAWRPIRAEYFIQPWLAA